MKTLPVRHITAFDIYTNLILRRLSVRVDDEQYECTPDPHKPEEQALEEAMEALRVKVAESHGNGYELSLMPPISADQATKANNYGFPAL